MQHALVAAVVIYYCYYSFRHQHEQLQRDINRVLKLAQQQLQSKKVSPVSGILLLLLLLFIIIVIVICEQLLGDDEVLAVKEVRLAYESVKVVVCMKWWRK